MDGDDILHSLLKCSVTRDGITVQICIYRGPEDPGWLIEVRDHLGGTTVWDDPFPTDQEALDEAMRTIEEEGIAVFADTPGRS